LATMTAQSQGSLPSASCHDLLHVRCIAKRS